MLALKVIFTQIPLVYNPNHDIFIYARNMLTFLKCLGISAKKQRIESALALKDHYKHILKLLDNIILVILAAHIVCIGWHLVALIEETHSF